MKINDTDTLYSGFKSTTMKIRKAQIQDAEALSPIAFEAVEPHRQTDFTNAGWQRFLSAVSVEATVARLGDKQYQCFCAVENGEVLGFITISDGEKIDQLFIRPRAQGKGLARELWNHAKLACPENNKSYTVKSSTVAIPVYRKLGFVKVGERREENGIAYQLMELTIETKS